MIFRRVQRGEVMPVGFNFRAIGNIETNGAEQLLDAIKADAGLANTRVIMVTARGQAQDYEYGMQRGADAYFIKPFSPLQLVASIKEILAR